MFRQHSRLASFSLAKSFSRFTMISLVKRHVNSFSFFENHEEYEKIVSESSNKSTVKNSHRRDTRTRLQKLFVSLDFKNIIQETQKNFMNTLDDVIDDYNDLQKQINTMKFKINNELVIKIDVIALNMILSISIKSNVNASISVAMIKFQNNVNSINFASKFVKSSQKISAINVFVTHQNQIFFSAIQSFDQQIARNTQYESSNFRSFEKTREKRSFNANILHHNDEKSSSFFFDQNRNSFLHDHLQQINVYNETIENRQSRSRQRDDYTHQQNRFRSRHAFLSPNKSDELRDLMIIKQNQFKISNLDFFYLEYSKNKNSTDYVINEKKIIYINVQMFVQTVRRFTANKNILKHLHFCLKNAIQIWYIVLSFVKREILMLSIEIFCSTLITRYEDHLADSYAKFQTQQYTIRDAQKRRQFDEYVSLLMRYAIFLDMLELIVLTIVWNSLDKKLRKHVRRFDKRIIVEKFTRNLKNVANYYASDNKKNAIEIAYQREMKSNQKQIQNFERFERYSKSYIENYSTNYFFKSQSSQLSRNWQTSSRNAYIFATSQNRSQYSQQNQIFATQNLSSSQRITQYSARTIQYFMIFSEQKLLTNNASYNAFVSTFYEQYDYNANSEYDEKQIQTINENIKFEILEHANFDDIINFFHAKTFELEIFNDEIYIRHDMSLMSCNICKQNYFNNDDRARLNNHMMIIHEIDIKFSQFMNQKRYINWMKHAILHVVIIRESSSEREYVTIQTRLYDENNEKISVCIDIDFNVNFIDEFLLPKDNLWNRLHNCHSIIVRDIADERIVDKQMNIFLLIIVTDDIVKRIEIKIYVNKNIKAKIILNMNELDKIENDIVLWLDRKKMQLDECHVVINFTARDNQFVIFFANSTSKIDYTDLKSCLKSFDDKSSKKSIRFSFSKKVNEFLYKSIFFPEILQQFKSCKFENFESKHDSNIANLMIFANDFANDFAKIFQFCFHTRSRWMSINWRAFHINSIIIRRFAMKSTQKSNRDRRNLNDLWKKLNI